MNYIITDITTPIGVILAEHLLQVQSNKCTFHYNSDKKLDKDKRVRLNYLSPYPSGVLKNKEFNFSLGTKYARIFDTSLDKDYSLKLLSEVDFTNNELFIFNPDSEVLAMSSCLQPYEDMVHFIIIEHYFTYLDDWDSEFTRFLRNITTQSYVLVDSWIPDMVFLPGFFKVFAGTHFGLINRIVVNRDLSVNEFVSKVRQLFGYQDKKELQVMTASLADHSNEVEIEDYIDLGSALKVVVKWFMNYNNRIY